MKDNPNNLPGAPPSKPPASQPNHPHTQPPPGQTNTNIDLNASVETREIDSDKLVQYFDHLKFVTLPPVDESRADQVRENSWRLVMINLVARQEPLALEIWDEVTIGRRVTEPAVDIDLNPHNGLELGVSRMHASLRPTKDALLLFDRGSTNGTYCNAEKASRDTPVQVKDNDIISFAALKFLVKVVRMPGEKPPARKKARKSAGNPPPG